MYYGGNLDFVIFYLVISSKIHKNTVLDRPCTGTTLNLDISCTKTTSTPRAGGPAKPGLAASHIIKMVRLRGCSSGRAGRAMGNGSFERSWTQHDHTMCNFLIFALPALSGVKIALPPL